MYIIQCNARHWLLPLKSIAWAFISTRCVHCVCESCIQNWMYKSIAAQKSQVEQKKEINVLFVFWYLHCIATGSCVCLCCCDCQICSLTWQKVYCCCYYYQAYVCQVKQILTRFQVICGFKHHQHINYTWSKAYGIQHCRVTAVFARAERMAEWCWAEHPRDPHSYTRHISAGY